MPSGDPDDRLREHDEGIWTIEGDPISFVTFPYTLRSTVIDLGGGSLFVHSPVQLEVASGIADSLGRVRHLVSPNKLHHLFLGDWKNAYPEAKLHAPPGLIAKRPDLAFDEVLGDTPTSAWRSVLDQRVVRGSFFMEEVVFFHRSSRTLILGDLIENHDPNVFGPVHRALARANGMLAPRGTVPRNYRLTFWRRAETRQTLREILDWAPRRVIVLHGPCVEDDAAGFLRHAFRWVL